MVAGGVMVIACTGRPFPGAVPWVERLGLEGPIVCYQGAQVRALDGEMILDHGVRHDLAMEVVRYARERDLHVQAYRDDELMVERDRLVWNLGPPFASEILDGDQVLLPLRPKIVELLGLEPDKLPNEAGAVSRWGARTFARGPRELPNW